MNIEHERFQNQCMREHTGTETDLVVNRRKLQHFSHVIGDQNVCCVTFLKAAQPSYRKPTTTTTNNLHTAMSSLISRNESKE